MYRYSLQDLEALPTLCVGQADDLKVETETSRVWLSRCGIADGMPYEKTITVEIFDGDRWRIADVIDGETDDATIGGAS